MKKQLLRMIGGVTLMAWAGVSIVQAGSGHNHGDHGYSHEKKEAGPHGGRVVSSVTPQFEVFFTEDRKLKITAVDAALKPIGIGSLSLKLVGGDRKTPIRMQFVKEGEALLSDAAFPEGTYFPVVLQIKVTPDADTVFEKFALNLGNCGSCEYKEYACVCGH